MKHLCIIFRRAPHGTPHGREGLDLALLSASFEQKITLIFSDEGVLHLLDKQQPELVGCRDYISTFKALPLYDIEDVLVCGESLNEFGLKRTTLNIKADIVNAQTITDRLNEADEVMVF